MVRNVVGRWLGTAGLVALMAAAAPAQERGQGRGGAGGFRVGGFGGGAGGKIGLIQTDQVQQELKLTDEQKAKVGEVATRVREAGPQRGQGGGQVDREQLRERMQAMSRVVAEEEKKLDEILNDEQKTRLEQISLQVTGVRALARDEVASKLGLSDEQKEKVQAALRAQRGQGGGGQGQPNAAALRERRQQLEQQVLAVLNDEQKQKWDELKGEAFELQRRGGQGRRGQN
jgi:Spy/CpxP family protein refolding chaperone